MKNQDQTYKDIIENITDDKIKEFHIREKTMIKTAKEIGIKQTITDYLYAHAKYEAENYLLPCGETVENAANEIIRATSLYFKSKLNGVSNDDIDRLITEKSATFEGFEKIQYLATIILAQNFYSDKYADKSESALRVEFNKIISRDADETDEVVINRLRSQIDIQKLRNRLDLTETGSLLDALKDSSITDSEKLITIFESFPTPEEYAIKTAIIYSELTQNKIPNFENNIHPSLVSILVCSAIDNAIILFKENKGEITHEEAELSLNLIEKIVLFLFTLLFVIAVGATLVLSVIQIGAILFTIPVIGPYLGSIFVAFSFVGLLIYLDLDLNNENDFSDKSYDAFEEIALILKKRVTIPCTEKLKNLFKKNKTPTISETEPTKKTTVTTTVTNPA